MKQHRLSTINRLHQNHTSLIGACWFLISFQTFLMTLALYVLYRISRWKFWSVLSWQYSFWGCQRWRAGGGIVGRFGVGTDTRVGMTQRRKNIPFYRCFLWATQRRAPPRTVICQMIVAGQVCSTFSLSSCNNFQYLLVKMVGLNIWKVN